jgi:hypothetical protein
MKRETKAVIVQDAKLPVEKAVLAKSIVDLSRAAQRLSSASGLNDRALVILLAESAKVGRPSVAAVLSSLKNLEREWCR